MQYRKLYFIIFIAFLGACSKPNNLENSTKTNVRGDQESAQEVKVIYGEDDRQDLYAVSDAVKRVAASTVALVRSSKVRESDGGYSLRSESYRTSYNLCSNEPFVEQETLAFCSGSLIAKDLVLTAGHCIRNESSCASTKLVLDYALQFPGQEVKEVSADQVYSCSEVLATEVRGDGSDYAIIRLDRDVVDRQPLSLNLETPQVGETISVIGHPAGLPTKVTGPALVRSLASTFYVTNLDTYGGNSGSAVFNEASEIVGILVRGETDFVSAGSCNRSNRCSETGCRGEDVTRIDVLKDLLEPLVADNENPIDPEPLVVEKLSEVNLVLPDADQNGVLVEIQVEEEVVIDQVQVSVDIEHTWRGDLVLDLYHPDGTKVALQKNTGGSIDDLVGVYGLDLVSLEPLDVLKEKSSQGAWLLHVKDVWRMDQGRLQSWGLKIQGLN